MNTRRFLLAQGATALFSFPAAGAGLAPARSEGRAPLVFLDPGHGGKDPGAIGVSGTYEKDVALAAAKQLCRALEATGRYQVRLSRGTDLFVPLEQRVSIAQDQGATLFISMHADALADHSVRGASVYTLAEQASDSQTAALARRENAADRFGGPGFSGADSGASPEIAAILASLVRQETRVGSARMARAVVTELQGEIGLLQNPARHAGFVVLKAPDIPSVLVEMGFMSNPEDEDALRMADHRAKVAAALLRAINAYFARAGSLRMAG